jgi:hypothetical protein
MGEGKKSFILNSDKNERLTEFEWNSNKLCRTQVSLYTKKVYTIRNFGQVRVDFQIYDR